MLIRKIKKKMENIAIPKDLIESIIKNECILFVASGLSSKVKRSNGVPLPNWTSFLKELLEWAKLKRVPFNSNPDEIEEIIDKGNHLTAAEELHELINNNDFTDFLNSIFRDHNVKPTAAHKKLAKIPFRAVLTTNYDNLLEGAYAISNDGQLPKKFTQKDLSIHNSPLRSKDFFIFKMHGDLDRSDTIILGSRSYGDLIYKSPNYLSFLETLFTTHTVLFIGFGGQDPDLDYLLDRLSSIFSRTLNKHFILSPIDKFNFTERRRLLLDKRLEVIEYNPKNNHAEVDKFIDTILNVVTKTEDEKQSMIPQNVTRNIHAMIFESMDVKHDKTKTYGRKVGDYINSLDGFEVDFWANFDYFFDPKHNHKDILRDLYEPLKGKNNPTVSIIIISEKELKSNRFEKEIELTVLKQLEQRNKIIPIVIGQIEIPYILRNYHCIRLNEKFTTKDLEPLKKLIY